MRLWTLSMALLLVACSSPPPAPTQRAIPAPSDEPVTPHNIAATYEEAGHTWKAIVVNPSTSDNELVVLARKLHREESDTRFEIFDDGSQISKYVKWASTSPHAVPYPEAWINKHHRGMINRMLLPGSGRATWQLFNGAAHPVSPEVETR